MAYLSIVSLGKAIAFVKVEPAPYNLLSHALAVVGHSAKQSTATDCGAQRYVAHAHVFTLLNLDVGRRLVLQRPACRD